MSSEVVFDIETNGLTPDTIWCLCDSEGTVATDGYTFKEGVKYYAHNGVGFDYPVLDNLWGVTVDKLHARDTMVLSRLASPSRAGGHSLDNWGDTLGFSKGDHSDWSQYSEDMLTYCKRDVSLTERVLQVLRGELKGFSEQSIELEHQVAWIIQEQMDNGWLLDQRAVHDLLAELVEKKYEYEEAVRETFKPIAKAVKEITPKTNKDGSTSVVGLKYLGDSCLDLCGGPHTRIEFQEFNLGSRQQAAERLMALGWKPTKYTKPTDSHPQGQPIMSEEVLMNLSGFPEAELIADYMTVQKRIAMAQSWLDFVQEDGRVHGKVNSNGAVTGRATHYEPNLGQVTAGTKIYGAEMRRCWIVDEGCKLVGVDASGLELRCLAHYMNDPQYTAEVLEGDVHAANQKAAGLETRNQAKTFIYAYLYGAGDAKIGSIVGGTAAEGKRLKAKFLKNTPALKTLRERVEKASKRGWLQGLDGRRIQVRSAHAALNTLLQGAGAVIMKQAMVNLHTMAKAHKIPFKQVGWIHDEFQLEVEEKYAEKLGKLAAYAIAKAGTDLKLRCPMAGEYQIGDTWHDTH